MRKGQPARLGGCITEIRKVQKVAYMHLFECNLFALAVLRSGRSDPVHLKMGSTKDQNHKVTLSKPMLFCVRPMPERRMLHARKRSVLQSTVLRS